MINKRIIICIIMCLVLVTVALPLFSACSSSKEGKTLKVGIMTPTTGKAAEKGVPLGDVNLDCIKYINDELGGVNGYKIEVDWLDSKYDATQAVANVKKFMDDGCLFFTTSSSTEMGYVQETAHRAGVAGLGAYSSPSNHHPPHTNY